MSDNKHKSLTNLGESIKTGAAIQGERFKNKIALPNEHDNNAKLFGDLSESFGARPGDRPRGLFNNAAAGLFKGLEHGQKAKSIQKKEGESSKYDKFMDYFQESNNELIKQNQWYAEQEKRLETIKPFAVGGLEISYSGMDYATGNDRMRNVMEQAKLADPTIKGDYIGYVPNSPIVNMRDQDGNIIAYSLSNLVGEDVVKRVQGNYIDQQKQRSSEDKLQMEREFAPQKYEAMERRASNAEERTKLMADKTYQAAKSKYAPKIEAAGRVRVIAAKMKDLVTNNPGMFQSVLSSVWDSNDPGIIQKIAQQATNGQSAEAIKEMGKYIQELKIGVIKGLSNPNQSIDMIAAGTIPGKGMPDNSILKILDDLDYKAEHETKLNQEYLDDVEGSFGEKRNGGTKYAERSQEYIDGATKSDKPWSSVSSWKKLS